MKTIARRRRQGASLRYVRSVQRSAHAPRRWSGITRRIVGVVLLLGGLGFALYKSPRLFDPAEFPLRYVHLHGEWQYLDSADVQKVIAAHQSASFFALDIDQIQQQLNALPWVERASVQRRWPDALDVTLAERKVFARWAETELIDRNGQRFRPEQLPPESSAWPVLNGPDGQETVVMQYYQEARQALNQISLPISALVQDARGAWTLRLVNGLGLKLGKSELIERVQRFITLYPKTLYERLADIETVDLRYTNGLAVRWSHLTAGANAALAEANKAEPATAVRQQHQSAG